MPDAVFVNKFTKTITSEHIEPESEEEEEPLKEVQNMNKSPMKEIIVKGRASAQQPAITA